MQNPKEVILFKNHYIKMFADFPDHIRKSGQPFTTGGKAMQRKMGKEVVKQKKAQAQHPHQATDN